MKIKIVHKATLYIICVLSFANAYAQSNVRIKASVDRTSILIGERINLVYEADIPETQPIRFVSIDTIDHFEFIDRGKIDTTNTSTGTSLRQQFIITSFDSGQWLIPAYVIDGIQTDSFLINVGFTPFDTSQAYHDIKGIIEIPVEEEEKKNWIMWAVGGFLLLVALIYIFVRKKQPEIVVVPPVDPYTEAMKLLDSLGKRNEQPAKDYYTRLTDIFRNYLARKKNISSMQKTTDDIVVQLEPLKLPPEQYKKLAQSLRLADFVKFAKFNPSAEDDQESFNIIKETINSIEKSSVNDGPRV